jgi:hypothetical protein
MNNGVEWNKSGDHLWEARAGNKFMGLLGHYPKGSSSWDDPKPCWLFTGFKVGSARLDASLTLEEAQTVAEVILRMS